MRKLYVKRSPKALLMLHKVQLPVVTEEEEVVDITLDEKKEESPKEESKKNTKKSTPNTLTITTEKAKANKKD